MLNYFRNSVKFVDSKGGGRDNIKGLDVTGPPSKPMYFLMNDGGSGEIIIDSDQGSDNEESELNIATIEDPTEINISIDEMIK